MQVDLTKRRVVDEGEGRLWAESRGFHYFETSAQSGEGINEMFQVCDTPVQVFRHLEEDLSLVSSAGFFLLHHRHVRERREAAGVGGQRRLHQRAGRHHSTDPQQQGLMGHVGGEAWRNTVRKLISDVTTCQLGH